MKIRFHSKMAVPYLKTTIRHVNCNDVESWSSDAVDPVEPIIAGNTVVGSSFCTSTVEMYNDCVII